MKYLFITLILAFTSSCQEKELTDLTPNDGFRGEYWFNSYSIDKAIKDAKQTSPSSVDTVQRPDFLKEVKDVLWISTDTFAFENRDHQLVIDKIISTANSYNNIVATSKIDNNEDHYIFPIESKSGKIWLKVNKELDRRGWISTYKYTAVGYWAVSKSNKEDNCFVDLTPNDGFTSEYSFNSPKFKRYLKELHPAVPARTDTISKPDFLVNRSPFIATTGWIKTCEFTFEDQDYSSVIDAITSAAATYTNIQKSYHSESLAWFEPVSGYSKDNQYWLVPLFLPNGKIWLKVDRKRNEDRKGYKAYSYYYTATGYWMLGRAKDIDVDVS